jgi:hypothetical protein
MHQRRTATHPLGLEPTFVSPSGTPAKSHKPHYVKSRPTQGLELRGHGAKLPRKAVKLLPGPSFVHFQKATESGAVIRDNRASTPRGHASPITLTVIGFPACTVYES